MRESLVGLLAIVAMSPNAGAQTTNAEAIRAVREISNAAIADRDLGTLRGTWVEDVHVTASSGKISRACGRIRSEVFVALSCAGSASCAGRR